LERVTARGVLGGATPSYACPPLRGGHPYKKYCKISLLPITKKLSLKKL